MHTCVRAFLCVFKRCCVRAAVDYIEQLGPEKLTLPPQNIQAEIEFVCVERVSEYTQLSSETDEILVTENGNSVVSPHAQLEISTSSVNGAKATKGLLTASTPCASVVIRDLWLKYADHDTTYVLNGIELNITKGSKVALVGRTAAGKSTLFSALLHMYKFEGNIQLDGEDLGSMPFDRLRQLVRFIPQKPILFGDTLREALCGPSHDVLHDTVLWEALERVQMRTSVARLPDKLSTSMQGGGVEFSQGKCNDTRINPRRHTYAKHLFTTPLMVDLPTHSPPRTGERQLLCLARALLHLSPVLLCDEISASVDVRTDDVVHDIILDLDCTVLAICHRLHHISRFTHVAVLAHGKVVEFGTTDELIKNGRSILSSMLAHAGH